MRGTHRTLAQPTHLTFSRLILLLPTLLVCQQLRISDSRTAAPLAVPPCKTLKREHALCEEVRMKVFVSYAHKQGTWVWERLVPV